MYCTAKQSVLEVEICRISQGSEICGLFTNNLPMTGTIQRLTDKGFGFISQEGQEKDLFFHSSALVDVTFDELREGDAVSFDVEDSDKGPRATNVQRA